jgi:signal transduction histidine kinase
VVRDATEDDRFARDPYVAELSCCSLLGVPILGRGTPKALLVLENRLIRGAFAAHRLDAVKLIAGQLAVSLDNAQLYSELTASRARIVAAADESRRRLERDLHDGAQHRLVSVVLRLQEVRAAIPDGDADLAAELDDLAAETTSALDELRELARGIHPAILSEGGLHSALKALARRCTVPVELDVRLDRRAPEPIETAAYYLVAEAVTNAAKHANASVIKVAADVERGVLRLSVSDDGRGAADAADGFGLVGLRDRAEAHGGTLTVQTAPGAGTTVRADLPLDPTG